MLAEEDFDQTGQASSIEYRVKPRTDDDLEVEPPPRQRYPVHLVACMKEMVRSREVLFTFVERDVRVRYKQAVLGGFWAIVQPLMLMVIFTFVFGKIAKIPTGGIPYPIFSYTALVPWQLFASSIGYATSSIITNYAMIRKVYMPREVFPFGAVLSSGVDFLASTLILFVMLPLYPPHYYPRLTWLAYPLLLLVLLVLATAGALLVAGITVYFRDTRYGMPLILQVLLYATPVAYPLSRFVGSRGVLHGVASTLYPYVNPLSPIMDGFRRVLVEGQWPAWGPFASAAVVSFALMALSYRWYKSVDRNFADVV